MLCNNVGTKVTVMANYRVCMMHGIAHRTFFLYYGTRLILYITLRFVAIACNNFMLVSVNHTLPRYKADQ
ncbi:MAG: hypothetical protein JWR50_2993 [Mucilaginibacter sp.]|nr:hypothetical protein [Mucilaginibacter sp.]